MPLGDVPWYIVTFIVPQNPTRPLWHGWSIETNGQSPWEATQVAALDVLMDIAQSFGDELVGGPASSIPRVAPTEAEWTQEHEELKDHVEDTEVYPNSGYWALLGGYSRV